MDVFANDLHVVYISTCRCFSSLKKNYVTGLVRSRLFLITLVLVKVNYLLSDINMVHFEHMHISSHSILKCKYLEVVGKRINLPGLEFILKCHMPVEDILARSILN